ncbi:hypothetical protein [Mangrovimonas futianensis]|uniref:hypothetical protein n=1 Tax=Mangrovimonas futianensis TaxID=2895523 RepID=UPI001E3A17B9|nr:hypothetical protein [Mangrovimonas futianensis]MCF1420834.1 hypothetical protein [Mangrovimonas futianensis]
MLKLGFENDIDNFLSQPRIAKIQFDGFKVKYALNYSLKDKKKLFEVFKSIDAYFKNGYYKGPNNLQDLLNPKKEKTINKPKPVASSKKKSKKPKKNAIVQKQSDRNKKREIEIKPRKAPKHSAKYYSFIRLKQTFLSKGLKIKDIAEYYHFNDLVFFANMKLAFKKLKKDDDIKEEHLRFINNKLLEDLEKNKIDKETIVSKNPKTPPNYYKTFRG